MSRLTDPRDLFGPLRPPLLSREAVYVSPPPPGWDPVTSPPGSGTLADPYHSIATGIRKVHGGGVLLRGGHYNEQVTVSGIHGTDRRKIVIQPYRHEQVTIDCYEEEFLHPTDAAHWEQVPGSTVDEYYWTRPVPAGQDQEVARGAFLDTPRHTRLITYSQHDDLVATNDLDPRLVTLPADNHVWLKPKDLPPEPTKPAQFRNWFYMGPGIWFDTDGHAGPIGGRLLYARLSHTTNNIDDWPDYDGVTDPRIAQIALSKTASAVLRLTNCSYLVFRNLALRFGGEQTLLITNCTNLEFDHVNIRAGSRAIRFEASPDELNDQIVFHDGKIDGGLPTWLFRSDRKDTYWFVPTANQHPTAADVHLNSLGDNTLSSMISSRQNTDHVEFHHCEILNGHDVCVFGTGMKYHHNWIHNINDDALFMGGTEARTDEAWIYRNVITHVLTAFSFAADVPQSQVRIFRNLIDLREPTLGKRPTGQGGDGDVPLRQGQFYKTNGVEGPIDFWHNTCLVLDAGAPEFNAAGFTHYNSFQVKGVTACRRRSFNNIFVAVYTATAPVKPIAFLPPSTFFGPSDGNLYERVGPAANAVPRFAIDGQQPRYADLGDYQDANKPWERTGLRANPGFATFDNTFGRHQDNDDLRTRSGSPGVGTSVAMP